MLVDPLWNSLDECGNEKAFWLPDCQYSEIPGEKV
jgi:hypothetical protein